MTCYILTAVSFILAIVFAFLEGKKTNKKTFILMFCCFGAGFIFLFFAMVWPDIVKNYIN